MLVNLGEFLHPRIVEKALPLYWDSHFKHAALEAMTQVEIALRERGVAPKKYYGRKLVQRVFADGPHVTLYVPLGEDLQEQARLLFDGAFAYYRNYAAHDGTKIDDTVCIRIMVLASELLDLVGASQRSFEGVGGVEGLIKEGIFTSASELADLLRFLDGQLFPHETIDGFYERFYELGFQKVQLEAVFDLGLVVTHWEYVDHSAPGELPDWDNFGSMELTEQGKRVLAAILAEEGDVDERRGPEDSPDR